MRFSDRIKHAWNAFSKNESEVPVSYALGESYFGRRPDMSIHSATSAGTIVTAIYNRIAIDVASVDIKHVRLDDNGRFTEVVKSDLNECLQTEANIDQTSRAFVRDLVLSLFDEGVVAVVPVETTQSPIASNIYDIRSLRVGQIMQWFPAHVQVKVYNEKTGRKEELVLPKKMVAIIENPLYSVMNEPNSTIARLTRKFQLLDTVDEITGSGKLDIIFQLPYAIKSDMKEKQAKMRLDSIEKQLETSKKGIAYIDSTEKVTQLNRPIENKLIDQIKYLTEQLFNQLGLTEEIFKGTASEEVMIQYYNRTVEPVLSAITQEMRRKFLTKTARTQGQSITFFRDPFKLVTVSTIADIADRFTRNEILTSNEVRALIGLKPSEDPNADELRNKNLNQPNAGELQNGSEGYDDYEEYDDYEDPEQSDIQGEG